MAQCERLQEANAAMGLGDFVRLLGVFGTRSALKLRSGNATCTGESGGWRSVHELEAVRMALQQLLGERFIGACAELNAVAMRTLDTINDALADPAVTGSLRQLRMLKLRSDESSNAVDDVGGPRNARLTLRIAENGHCTLNIRLTCYYT